MNVPNNGILSYQISTSHDSCNYYEESCDMFSSSNNLFYLKQQFKGEHTQNHGAR